ncbi:MAG: electron transfer flavoprotein subunit beta/FixA family protein [Chlorobi bacterium]|nr:electron transfer flavoprotein subunit beta/FixA family protein [Chlorobiota bacterium]MCI0716775.1 electron transfer flavoprotein subunit beta/FixA family protein [Chlorobiota bacterium]
MKIAVCISQVPDTTTKVKIGSDGKSIDPSGVTFIINPYDEFAVEEALKLKEKQGGETFVLTLGKDSAKEVIRKAYAMGIEKGLLIKSETELDSYAVARNLADVLKDINADIILCGKQSIDFDNNQVGSLLAEMLGLPSISVVVGLTVEGNKVRAEREVEGGKEVVESTLPVVICAQRGLNEPRYPNLKGIMQAKSKPIEEKQPAYTQNKIEILSMSLPKPKPKGKIVGTDLSAVPELVRLLREEAKVI